MEMSVGRKHHWKFVLYTLANKESYCILKTAARTLFYILQNAVYKLYLFLFKW